MKQKTTILKTIVLAAAMMLGGASSAWADTRTWDFSDGTLWTSDLVAGYYTPTGGSTPLENAPADLSTAIYVVTTNGLVKQNEGSYKGFFYNGNNSNTKPTDEYISIEIPVGYTLSATGQTTNANYSNTFTFAVWDGDTQLYVVTSNTTKTTREYKNEGSGVVTAYIYNNSTNGSRLLRVFDITLSDEKVKHAYTINLKAGETTLSQLTGEAEENTDFTISLPKAVKGEDNYWYVLDESSNRTDFSETLAMGTSDYVKDYSYTKDESIYYYEELGGSVNDAKYSGGSGKGVGTPFSKEIEESGKYELSFNQYKWGSRATYLYIGDVLLDSYGDAGIFTKSINLLSSSTIALKGSDNGANNSSYVDYVLIRRTGDAVTSVPVAIPSGSESTGYASLSSALPLDCGNLPSGVKAYKVTSINKTDKKVVLAEVTGTVEAGTGLIISGTAGQAYNIPVVVSGSAVADNLLKAAVSATHVDADAAYGLKDGKFVKLNAGDIPAGKAYLLASDIQAPELTIDFGGTTDIGATLVNSEERKVNSVYDLQGRQVNGKLQRGLYIVNGKKVIVK